jgi:hypothetical protein
MTTSETVEFDPVDHSTIEYKSRWNNLRAIGNSPIARASIAVPILGYLILFQKDLIDYLSIHASFCDGCTVSWRLHFLYFGSCSFALGALIYGAYCPPLIKRYGGATEFFDSEKYYFTNARNYQYLRSLIARDRKSHAYHPRVLATLKPDSAGEPDPSNLIFLAGAIGEYYVLQNMSYPFMRRLVAFSYLVGGALLGIPTVWTFGQVFLQAAGKFFKSVF